MEASKITAIDFFQNLGSKFARRRFFWSFLIFGLLSFAALAASHAWAPEGACRETAIALSATVCANSIVILFFYIIYIYFIGPANHNVSVVRPRDINDKVRELPTDTIKYIFWGRSGSYFRSEPLNKLNEIAQKNKRHIEIEVLLPDPTDQRLIESYNQILSALGEPTAPNPLLANVLATSIACAAIMESNKFVSIKIFYSKFLPAFRVDLSDNGAILTQDDPAKSALFFEPKTEFYEMLRTTAKNEINVSTEAKWDRKIFQNYDLSAGTCSTDMLRSFGLEFELTSELALEVSKLAQKPTHRYE